MKKLVKTKLIRTQKPTKYKTNVEIGTRSLISLLVYEYLNIFNFDRYYLW
jgi:hypothetical protein